MKESKDYYVYQLKYRGVPLYIGYGRGDRINHVLSGASHNKYLNKFVAFGCWSKDLSLVKVCENLTRNQAKNIESCLIKNINPYFNVSGADCANKYVDDYLEMHRQYMHLSSQRWFDREEDVINYYISIDYGYES